MRRRRKTPTRTHQTRGNLHCKGLRLVFQSSPVRFQVWDAVLTWCDFLASTTVRKYSYTLEKTRRKRDTYCISPTVSRPVSIRLDESLLFLISSGVEEIPSLSTTTSSSSKKKRDRKRRRERRTETHEPETHHAYTPSPLSATFQDTAEPQDAYPQVSDFQYSLNSREYASPTDDWSIPKKKGLETETFF